MALGPGKRAINSTFGLKSAVCQHGGVGNGITVKSRKSSLDNMFINRHLSDVPIGQVLMGRRAGVETRLERVRRKFQNHLSIVEAHAFALERLRPSGQQCV